MSVEHALQQNWSRLFAYGVRLCGSRDAAADLLQSCAVKALASRPPERDAEAMRAWLFRIMRNAWIDDHRRAAVRATEPISGETGAAAWRYDDRLIAEITVRQGLERLETDHREIVELVDLVGFSYAEAAGVLGVPLGTVMSRLSRARLALLEQIEGRNVRPLGAGRRHAG